MSLPTTTRVRAIKDLAFTDDHVWIHGKVTRMGTGGIDVDDGTGTLHVELGTGEDGGNACAMKGAIQPGALVRVIGDIITSTTKQFSVKATVIQDIGSMGATLEQLEKMHRLEETIKGES